jgi:hypothetical protein
VAIAEFMREVGLKCIGFNGVCSSFRLLVVALIDGIDCRFRGQSTCSTPSAPHYRRQSHRA